MNNEIVARHQMTDIPPHLREFSPLDGPTTESIAAAKAAQAQERQEAEAAGVAFVEGTAQIRRHLRAVPKDENLSFVAMVRFDMLQLQETKNQEEVAKVIADRIYGLELADIGRREAASCRFHATYALRSQKPGWLLAAQKHAEDTAVETLKTQGGAAFRELPEAHLQALARLIVSRVVPAHTNVLDGSRKVSPAEYLRITTGEAL